MRSRVLLFLLADRRGCGKDRCLAQAPGARVKNPEKANSQHRERPHIEACIAHKPNNAQPHQCSNNRLPALENARGGNDHSARGAAADGDGRAEDEDDDCPDEDEAEALVVERERRDCLAQALDARPLRGHRAVLLLEQGVGEVHLAVHAVNSQLLLLGDSRGLLRDSRVLLDDSPSTALVRSDDLGIDSLVSLDVIQALQRSLEITLPTTLLIDCPTLDFLCEYLINELQKTRLAP